MSGMTVPVIGMTTFDFQKIANGSPGVEVIAAQNIDVSSFTEATLLVRVHSLDVDDTASAKLHVIAYAVLPSPQDPSKTFRSSTALGSVTLDDNSQDGTLEIASLTPPLGAFLTIALKAETNSTPNALTATISVDLSLKSS